jgi:hypothetical protein
MKRNFGSRPLRRASLALCSSLRTAGIGDTESVPDCWSARYRATHRQGSGSWSGTHTAAPAPSAPDPSCHTADPASIASIATDPRRPFTPNISDREADRRACTPADSPRLCHRVGSRRNALPLRCYAVPGIAFALPRETSPCRAKPLRCGASRNTAPPLLCVALNCLALPLRGDAARRSAFAMQRRAMQSLCGELQRRA